MGNENEYTWSEANYDEKDWESSFKVCFSSLSNLVKRNQENKLQILNYNNQLLEKGGEISHQMEVRRSVTDSTGIYLFSLGQRIGGK